MTIATLAAQAVGLSTETVMLGSAGMNVALVGLLWRNISSKVDTLTTAVTRLEAKMGDGEDDGLVGTVRRIHKWKNDQTIEALTKANAMAERLEAENQRLREKGHLHMRADDLKP